MEVQIVNKAKGETDIIIGIEAKVEKTKTNEIFTRKQNEKFELDVQKKIVNQQKKRLFGSVRKARNKTGY